MENNLAMTLKRKYYKEKWIGFGFAVLLMITFFSSINLGRANIGTNDVIRVILGKIADQHEMYAVIKESYAAIIWNIRIPRVLVAIIVGSGLAVSGAVFQSLLMNPLADSYTMGVSSGAAFGATIAMFVNMFIDGFHLSITLCAFIGAFLTLGVVVSIAKVKGYLSSSNLIIAGIIVTSILSAGIKFLKSLAGENVSVIVNWLMGSLASRSWEHVFISFPIIMICIIVCIYFSEDLNLLCLGEKEAKALGVDTQHTKRIFLICGSLITAVCVSVSGIISFIGLIVPHMLRFAIGSDNRVLIPLSALLGGELLLLADTATRSFMNVEIPVGVLTTLLGGPFFIYIFMTRNKSIQ
ncbi:FecCD family ABC transporter permease [Marinisporobacter balticus]|uniref:Iron complex transport system permease protein n=1 Tax=Marinisporobacter balticus TaxID=2018667 RepID=A0A4V2SAM9_9FIRM|nr:iron ABC transporter permease [Marinisporobacter balticus]TCO72280.1 iron complex transport system permease protein [Marinisporobacter balticus]